MITKTHGLSIHHTNANVRVKFDAQKTRASYIKQLHLKGNS